jgi:hypothetical protein
MSKIFCFGDGFAANHIWPEWPAILSALYDDVENFGAVGAGNEYITSAIVMAHKKCEDAVFVIQWSPTKRFDKMLEDDQWANVISTDAVYNFNVNVLGDSRWWLSSASTQTEVQRYHDYYVQSKQDNLRTETYQYLVSQILKNQSIIFSTNELEKFSKQDRFANYRQKQVQPSPVVHMAFVEEFILPRMKNKPDSDRVNRLKQRIIDQEWVPFHWDRDQIWQDLTNHI